MRMSKPGIRSRFLSLMSCSFSLSSSLCTVAESFVAKLANLHVETINVPSKESASPTKAVSCVMRLAIER